MLILEVQPPRGAHRTREYWQPRTSSAAVQPRRAVGGKGLGRSSGPRLSQRGGADATGDLGGERVEAGVEGSKMGGDATGPHALLQL